ncbi:MULTISPECIES: hypothetical protein [unclassified Chryseobacterium]|uniref:hypothetical protein n=1 Tax=unclassified Chryseobacterium TaxID=2593645 RepID=UPI001E3CD14F|nr:MULTISPECIES: hypothetical protein [unclassified Chryseobacterium]
MKTKLLFAVTASFLSLTAFSQKKKQADKPAKQQEMAIYAEKKEMTIIWCVWNRINRFRMFMCIPTG